MRPASFITSLLLPLILAIAPAQADTDRAMLDSMIGNWEGQGRLTYTQTWTFDFKCKVEGRPATVDAQVDLLGKCWSGPIWSRMAAALRYDPESRSYVGKFRDGTNTFVIDMRGKPAPDAIDLDLRQGKTRGAMALAFQSDDQIELEISVLNPRTKAKRKVIDLVLARRNTRLGALAD